MKRRTFAFIFLAILITICTSIVWATRRAQSMDIRFNVKDYPEYGLYIVSPVNQDFNKLLSSNQSYTVDDRQKTFSVFLKNTGPHTLVAYALKWELLRSDGRVITHTMSYAQPGLLMGERLSKEDIKNSLGVLIGPGYHKLFSWGGPISGSINQEFKTNIGVVTSKDAPQPDDLQAASTQLNAQLLHATDITVSIDGAFFEDGTFVGENTSEYYEQMDAQIRAKRDVLDTISSATKESSDKAFDEVEGVANAEAIRIQKESTPIDHYNFYKRIFAREITGMKKGYSKSRAVEYAQSQRNKNWPKLRKL